MPRSGVANRAKSDFVRDVSPLSPRRWLSGLFALLALLAAGCASLQIDGPPPELAQARRVFVEERLNDNLRVDRMLVEELRARGYVASHGPLTMLPGDAQFVVTYDARETWDFRPYVIELTLAVRPAKDYNQIVASGRYFRPGVTIKSTAAMVREVVGKLFPPAAAPAA